MSSARSFALAAGHLAVQRAHVHHGYRLGRWLAGQHGVLADGGSRLGVRPTEGIPSSSSRPTCSAPTCCRTSATPG
jgi:hypothetical protein